jgi:hypothetical protein
VEDESIVTMCKVVDIYLSAPGATTAQCAPPPLPHYSGRKITESLHSKREKKIEGARWGAMANSLSEHV